MGQKVFRQYRQRSRETVRRAGEVTPSEDAVRAQNDFAFFCAYLTRNSPDPKIQPPHMAEWNEQLLTGKSSRALDGIAGPNVDILAPRGSAKAQPLDEPVLTPDGFVPMGSLKVGDRVMTADGSVARITHVTPQGIKDNYRVEFTDGAFTHCSLDHLWSVADFDLNHNHCQVLSLGQIVDAGYLDDQGFAKYYLPKISASIKWLPPRGIVAVQMVGTAEMQCITINHPSQLYITRDHIVTHNSTYLGMFAAWSIGRHAMLKRLLQILYISYTVDVARPKSAAIKSIIESPEYREIFPTVIPGRKWSDEYWCIDLEFAGISIVGQEAFSICCAGLKGAIVSKRCLVGETLVRTDEGDYPIESFHDRIGAKVLTLDEVSQSPVWRSVIACESHESSDIVEVKTGKGVSIKCTSDHPFYVVGEGFIDAAKLKANALICSIDANNNLLQADHIVSVNKIEGSQLVYDIEVEGTHNFFANGVCVHNSHLILLDDLVKSEFDIANPEIREQMEQNWTRSILPTMFDGGRAICLGTRFRADDIHCSTFTTENGWVQIEQSAIIDDEESEGGEKSYWDFWSLEHLQSIRALDPIGFSFQYQNKIVRTTEVSIHPEWIIKSSVPRDIRKFEQIGIGVDLSSKTKERHDFTVMVLGGRLNNKYYILDMWRGRVAGNKSKLEHLLELCYAWDIVDSSGKYYLGTDINCYLYVEDVAYQASLKGDFQTYVINELSIHNLIYRPIFSKGDKLSKLRSVTGLFENELVRFNEQAKLGAAIEELVSFGATAHDDCADAIELLLNGLRSSAPLEIVYG